jgi:hypothetical protein
MSKLCLKQMDGNVVSVMASERQDRGLATCLKGMADTSLAGIPWRSTFCCYLILSASAHWVNVFPSLHIFNLVDSRVTVYECCIWLLHTILAVHA